MDGTPSCIKNCPTPGSSYGKLGIDLIVTIHKLQHTMLGGTKLYRVRLEAGNEKVHTSWTKGQWEEQHNLHIDPTCTKLKIFLVKGAGFARAVVACAKLDIKQEILDRRFPQSVIVPLMQDGKEICQLNFSFALQPKSTQALPSGLLRLLKEAAAREKETRASQVKGVSTARSTASWVAKGRSRPSPALIPSNDPMWVKSLGKNLEDAPASTQIGTVSERTSLLSNGIDESPMRRKKYASTVSSEVSDNDRSRSRADSDMSLSKKQLLSDPKVVAQTCCGYLKKAGFGGWMQTRYFAIIPGKKPSEHWQLAWWESIERFRSGQTPRNSVSVMTIDSIQPAIQPNEFSIHFKAYEGDNKAPPHKVIVLSANCTDSRPRDVWMEALQYFLVVYKNARQQLLYRQIQQKQATIPEHDVSDSGSNASSRPRAISRAATLPTLSPAGIPESSPYLTVERRKSTVSPQSQPLPPVRSNIQRHNSLTSIGLGSCHASPMLEPQPAGPGHLRGRPTITPRHTPVMRPTPRDPPNSWRTPSLAPSVMDQDALVFTPLSELESLSKLESERVGTIFI